MHWFAYFPLQAEKVIKRESGANPEQSRCCEFHTIVISTYHLPLESFPGRPLIIETSQKTCHAYLFIIAFEEKAVSLMNTDFSVLSFYSSKLLQRK
ncbi:putative uncharacterized protein [Bacteroides sp. CAG:598]|nr:putative uncharacterized protein [Bacteroides sp. CAG:598]